MPQGLWPYLSNRIILRKIFFVLTVSVIAFFFFLEYSPKRYLKSLMPSYSDTDAFSGQQIELYSVQDASGRYSEQHATTGRFNTRRYSSKEALTGHQIERFREQDASTDQTGTVNSVTSASASDGKNFTIHIWKHGERMRRRFLRSYGNKERDPFQFCKVRNCLLCTDDSKYNESNAVFFHMHQTKGPDSLPSSHPSHQVWVFFTDESPFHTFFATKRYTMRDYDGIFNWSMTYRSDADVPVPYGRTQLLTASEKNNLGAVKNYARLKSHGIAILGSNCGGNNGRWSYVRQLQKHIQVDVYGDCGTLKCSGHFTKDCPLIDKYKFYLAFENSNCREYITEKLWWNGFHKEAVPVVMGAPKEDYERLAPPNSFIHVDDFDSPADLAAHLTYLQSNDTAYNEYFAWKREHKVVNEHGYFGSLSLHLCHLCEALNDQRSLPKTYSDLDGFWNPKTDCLNTKWKPS